MARERGPSPWRASCDGRARTTPRSLDPTNVLPSRLDRRGRRLIVFTRNPAPGKAKTRLIPALGPEGAARLQERMTEHTLRRVRTLSSRWLPPVEVRYAGGSEDGLRQWLGADLTFSEQGEGTLGDRMERAFEEGFAAGLGRLVLIGTDCPGITGGCLREAFRRLMGEDLVLGPSRDGGYYLIGLRRPVPALFRHIPWGTDRVLSRTLRVARSEGLRVGLLDPLDDVDVPEDLPVWAREQDAEGLAGEPPRISVILPTLDEAERVGSALAATRGARHVVERIVVDGGSRDGTRAVARALGARVLETKPERAAQMNLGARRARGDVLLFLHADTILPAGFAWHIQETLSNPRNVAGAFRLGIAGPAPGLRIIERLANFRSVWMGMPYGDQAIFVRASSFAAIGGFPEMPIMEDFELMRRLRRQGRVRIAPSAVRTCGRRYDRIGVLRTTGINQAVIAAYLLGVRPARLARWYRSGDGEAVTPAE